MGVLKYVSVVNPPKLIEDLEDPFIHHDLTSTIIVVCPRNFKEVNFILHHNVFPTCWSVYIINISNESVHKVS